MTDLFTVVNPATAQPITEVPLASVEEADAAIARAHEAFATWRAVAPGERAALLRRDGPGVDAPRARVAELLVREARHT